MITSWMIKYLLVFARVIGAVVLGIVGGIAFVVLFNYFSED